MGVIETLIVTTALAGVAGTGLGGLIGENVAVGANHAHLHRSQNHKKFLAFKG
jgi:hypothetical protein